MNTVILASSLGLWDYDELGNRIPKKFSNINGLLDVFRKYIKKYDNFLYVASLEDSIEITDMYAKNTFKAFDLTLPFKNYEVLDIRTEKNTLELIEKADFIYLCGGHVPTQNNFFNKINLKDIIKKTDALIVGVSAGSMNCAKVVYCPPELDEEALNKSFKKYYDGLGLTDINIIPHYSDDRYSIIGGKRYIEDIVLPDSYNTTLYAISDGDYILVDGNKKFLYGNGYKITDGKIIKLEYKKNGMQL